MKQIKIRRQFARKRFYERTLSAWKADVVERKFSSSLGRALINLKAYPIEVIGIKDLRNVKGIGEYIAQKLESAWVKFCAQSESEPTLGEVDALEANELLRFLSVRNQVKRRPPNISAQIPSTSSNSSEHLASTQKAPADLAKTGVAKTIDSDGTKQILSIDQESSDPTSSLIFHNPTNFDDSMVVLVIDNRERNAVRKCESLLANLCKKNVTYEFRSLSIGDYIWLLRTNDGHELVLDYIIERKTFDDLQKSIREQRYEEQKRRLMSVGLRNIIYILEGAHTPNSALEQALVTTNIENGFLVYRSRGIEETAQFLAVVTERLKQRAKTEKIVGMSFEEFQRSSKKTKCRTVRDIFIRQLVVCPQMSAKKAVLVASLFPTFTSLANFYASIPSEQQALALSECVAEIPRALSTQMAKFFAPIIS